MLFEVFNFPFQIIFPFVWFKKFMAKTFGYQAIMFADVLIVRFFGVGAIPTVNPMGW